MISQWSVRAENLPGEYSAWRGPSLLVLDADGRASPTAVQGWFFRETRYISQLGLRLNGEAPLRCSVAQVNANRLEFTFIYPPVNVGAGGGSGSGGQSQWKGILRRGIDVQLAFDIHPASIEISARLTSRWDERAEVDIEWQLQADYAAIPEAQSGKREQTAKVTASSDHQERIRFCYEHPDLRYETHVKVDMPGPWRWHNGALSCRAVLDRQQTAAARLHISAIDPTDPIDEESASIREHALEQWEKGTIFVTASGETPLLAITNRAVRNVGSFSLLEGAEDEWLTPGAGVPLYLSLWARDALTAVWQSSLFDRGDMATAALTRIGRLQGRCINEAIDEEPGRIIQQARNGPLERLGKSSFSRYYADQASPFDFIFALVHAYACRGDKELIRQHWDTCRRILDWARDYGDRDGDGFLEYQTSAPGGPRHQGWKDSDNAIVDAEGHQVGTPVAACEVQGYYYAALQVMSALAALQGHAADAAAWWRTASELRNRFNESFWMPKEGFLAVGLDADKRQIKAVTSNGGQALATGILAEENMPQLVRRLFEPDLFSGWGIRTLSSNNPAYNPLDYHLGSVWLIENATIVFGLRRFGFDERAVELARALYDLAMMWPVQRVPECVGGYPRGDFAHPGAYPRANAPQMWNESAWLLIVQTLLGLQPMAPVRTLAVDPVLPEWLSDVTVHRLRVGHATVTLRFQRKDDGRNTFKVLQRQGTLHVLRQPSPNSLKAGIWDRFAGLFESALSMKEV
jgi:glycogen debranching enzyme